MSITRGQHLIGQEIGSCILEKLLGYGGSSAVFLAQNRTADEKVAVKVFLPRSTMDKQMQKDFYRRFLKEAQAASELNHPNILPIYSYGEHHGLPYIVMPYMTGGTLSENVTRHGPLSLTEAQSYLEQISSALDYAHEHACVHCDVKPANILLDGTGHTMLSDFGIVRLMQPEGAIVQQPMKSAETLMGTPDYISPEQALGEQLDGRSDVYSLAATLFFLLVGSAPFKAETPIALALKHVNETPPAPGTLRADAPPQIDKVVAQALSKRPEERFQTAGEFSAAFAEAVANAAQHALLKSSDLKKASVSDSGGKQAIAALKHIVQIKPAEQGAFSLRRFMLSAMLLLLVITGSVITVNVVRIANEHPPAHPTPTTTPSDYLVGKQSAWPEDQQDRLFFFHNGQYYIKNTSSTSIAMALYAFGNYTLTDFSLTVRMTEIQGSHDSLDYYGIILRFASNPLRYYLFEIAASNGGQYLFWRHDEQAPYWHAIDYGSISNFAQRNVITAEVKGNTFTFFLNKKPVGTPVKDPLKQPVRAGDIGLCVEEKDTEVAFSQLYIEKLSVPR